MTVSLPDAIHFEVKKLLAAVDSNLGNPLQFIKLNGGANNQVFRVETNELPFCLKWYFSHPSDPRNRLAHEDQFLKYAWLRGIRNIPQPLGTSTEKQLALFTYVKGHSLAPGELCAEHIEQAIQFVQHLNRNRESSVASVLPIASEASFSWQEQIATVEQRIDRLKDLSLESDLHEDAANFFQQQMLPLWVSFKSALKHRLTKENPELGEGCNRLSRIVSPSDFGFHNAIRHFSGNLYFIDFEYAGWDSPVKFVCDFFHQPQVPVPLAYLDDVISKFERLLPENHSLRELVNGFLPVYGMKWCCILLNDFLPIHESRRSFSQGQTPSLEQLDNQLKKARQKFDSLEF